MDKQVIDKIQKIDPLFEKDDFVEWVSHVLIELEQAWSEKKLDILKKYETNTLFLEHKEQLENMEKRQVKNVVEDVSIDKVEIISYQRYKNRDYIEVHIEMSLIDYYISIVDAQILQGHSSEARYAKYKLIFEKTADVQSQGFLLIENNVCPYCGAPIEKAETMHCDYCNQDIQLLSSVYKVGALELLCAI